MTVICTTMIVDAVPLTVGGFYNLTLTHCSLQTQTNPQQQQQYHFTNWKAP